jgi:hypothetical protein
MKRTAILGLLVAACGSTPVTPTRVPSAPIETSAAATASDQLDWFLTFFNEGMAEPTDEVAAHFTDEFLAEIPLESLYAGLGPLVAVSAPLTLVYHLEPEAPNEVQVAVHGADGSFFRIHLGTTADGLIAGFGMRLSPEINPDFDQPADWADLEERLRALAPEVNLLVAEVADGDFTTIFAVDSDRSLPIASSVKLYVLAELTRQIGEGLHRWDELLPINDALDVIPTGEMQHLEPGTEITLQEYALQMISISDNTASDHLIHLLGRDAVEQMIVSAGHHDPDSTFPLLTLREFMVLKLQQPAEDVVRYLESSVDERRRFLVEELSEFDYSLAAGVASFFWADRRRPGVGWFASAEDLCRIMIQLWELGNTYPDAPLPLILGTNPATFGLLDRDVWEFVGYKGGSEPGVFSMNWLMRSSGGRWFVISMGAGADEAIDLTDFHRLTWGAMQLLTQSLFESS